MNNPKPEAKNQRRNRRLSASAGSGDPVWIICKPVADALAHAAVEGHKLALLTNFARGGDIVAMAADVLGKINQIVSQNEKLSHGLGTKTHE